MRTRNRQSLLRRSLTSGSPLPDARPERRPDRATGVRQLPRTPKNASPVPHLTSLYHFSRAGEYGDRTYPGNCGGNLIKDLLLYSSRAAGEIPLAHAAARTPAYYALGRRPLLRLAEPLEGRPVAPLLSRGLPHPCRLQAVPQTRRQAALPLSWDPILFSGAKSRLWHEVPRDWHLVDLTPYDGYQGDNPVPCPAPLRPGGVHLPRDHCPVNRRPVHGQRHHRRRLYQRRQGVRRYRARPRLFRLRLSSASARRGQPSTLQRKSPNR